MNSISAFPAQYNPQASSQRPAAAQVTRDFFAQVDPKNSGSFDKNSLSQVAEKVSISQSGLDAMFKLMDSNGDGAVTKQEFTDLLQNINPQGEGNSANNPPPTGAMHGHGGGPPPPKAGSDSSTSGITDPADTNGDGVVSAAEALAYSQTTSAISDSLSNSETSTETERSGDDVMTSRVMNMMSSYASAEKGTLDSTSSWTI